MRPQGDVPCFFASAQMRPHRRYSGYSDRLVDSQYTGKETKSEESSEGAITAKSRHLPARKGAHVLAHGFPLPKPETVILANQNNFSISHGIFSI